jgi:NAD(P)-dependent dehydrogenase (short-subunit alcohol dehydrogenase family)
MKKRFSQKAAIVTGGVHGIGGATVKRLSREGAAVLIADVLDADGEALAEELRKADRRAVFEHVDVSDEMQWRRAVDRALAAFGHLDVLVNNAGIARLEDAESETLEGYERLIAVNQTGTWLGMKTAIPLIRKSGGGAVVNVASIYGTVGGNGTAIAYHASKGAVRLMTKNAAIRYAKENVRVNSVHPGFIDTPMVAPLLGGDEPAAKEMRAFIERGTPMGRIGTADEVAAVIAFLASDDASYVTGSEVYVDGGWTAW